MGRGRLKAKKEFKNLQIADLQKRIQQLVTTANQEIRRQTVINNNLTVALCTMIQRNNGKLELKDEEFQQFSDQRLMLHADYDKELKIQSLTFTREDLPKAEQGQPVQQPVPPRPEANTPEGETVSEPTAIPAVMGVDVSTNSEETAVAITPLP